LRNVGRIWTYVRDDRPFGGKDPPAALFYYSRNRAGEHPQSHLAGYVGLMQADAFTGYNDLYEAKRKPAPILEAACWSHGRRKFFDLAKSGEAADCQRGRAAYRGHAIFSEERRWTKASSCMPKKPTGVTASSQKDGRIDLRRMVKSSTLARQRLRIAPRSNNQCFVHPVCV